jgi:hypothetical protein
MLKSLRNLDRSSQIILSDKIQKKFAIPNHPWGTKLLTHTRLVPCCRNVSVHPASEFAVYHMVLKQWIDKIEEVRI